MHSLIVLSNPNPASLTHAISEEIGRVLAEGGGNSVEIADLAREGFDPRFSMNDIGVINRQAAVSADIRAEQERIERADRLVIVYPVYWWSMPGLLKGWIDRVFSNGWAYNETPDGRLEKKLGRLAVHLVAIGAATGATYAKRGYATAMQTQIDHGIFDYCGARLLSSDLLLIPDAPTPADMIDEARWIARRIHDGGADRSAA